MNLLDIKAPNSPALHAARIEVATPADGRLRGDRVTGRVVVAAGQGAPPRESYVELQYVCLGEVSAVALVSRESIPSSNWRANEPFTFAFSLAVPELPVPYQGRLFRSTPRVALVLGSDPASRAFPIASQELSVDAPSPLVLRRIPSPGRKLLAKTRGSGRGLAMGVAFLVLGLLALAISFRSLGVGPGDSRGASIVLAATFGGLSALFLLIGGLIARGTYGNWRSERVLGQPEVQIVDRLVGESSATLSVAVAVVPLAPVREVTLSLRVTESLQDPQTEDLESWCREHTVAELSFPLGQGEPGRWSVELATEELEELPTSISLIAASVYWDLSLEVSTSSGHRWVHRARLVAFRGSFWEPNLAGLFVFGSPQGFPHTG